MQALPVCFDLPKYGPQSDATESQPSSSSSGPSDSAFRLHAADDLFTLFELTPLWEESVKPFAPSSRSIRQSTAKGAGGAADDDVQPRVLEKTYAEYVKDLPGKVRPAKRTVNKFNAALANASSMDPPVQIPVELSGRSTMRDIVFRPETTIQRVGPFDDEALRSAFAVTAGDISSTIDLSLLESDEIDRTSSMANRKRKKRKYATGDAQTSDETAAKRSRLNAIVSARQR